MGLLGGIASAIGGPIVGGILGNSASNKASKKAAAATLQATREANALQERIYGLNTQNISPFIERGNVAGNYLNAFLGLPGQQQESAQPQQPAQGQTALNALMDSIGPKRTGQYQQYFGAHPNLTPEQKASYLLGIAHNDERGIYQNALAAQQAAPMPQQPQQAPVTQADAQGAFGNYIKASDYGFQFGEGANALNSGYAARGSLESGAAMKGLEKYRQNLQSGYRNEWTGQLAQQQGAGLQGANALAGVGTNFANASNQNTLMGGQARADDYLNRGANNAAFYGAMGSLGPRLASSFMGGGF